MALFLLLADMQTVICLSYIRVVLRCLYVNTAAMYATIVTNSFSIPIILDFTERANQFVTESVWDKVIKRAS